MIVDSSVIVASVRGEADASGYLMQMQAARVCRMSAASYLEAGIVIDAAKDEIDSFNLDRLIQDSGIVIEPVTESQSRLARQAYRAYGKGSGHPARLNFGDCFAYALAIELDEPLLFKGDDFLHTDVRVASAS